LENSSSSDLPRVAICGLAIESSTFSPAQSNIEAFRVRRGEDVFSYYPFLADGAPDRERAEWIPTLRGHAIPGVMALT
jgi:microcystin degradation protein MlrC